MYNLEQTFVRFSKPLYNGTHVQLIYRKDSKISLAAFTKQTTMCICGILEATVQQHSCSIHYRKDSTISLAAFTKQISMCICEILETTIQQHSHSIPIEKTP